jgi:hypothetical protein
MTDPCAALWIPSSMGCPGRPGCWPAAGLGLELTFERIPRPRGLGPEAALLDRLVSAGLCSPGQRLGLAAWPGCSSALLSHELWRSLIVRRLNHLKLLCRQRRLTQVKAYLAVHRTFWPSRPETAHQ